MALTFGVLAPGANGLAELAAGQQRGIALAIEDIAAAGGVLDGGVATVVVDESVDEPVETTRRIAGGTGRQRDPRSRRLGHGGGGGCDRRDQQLLVCSASATAASVTYEGTAASFFRTAIATTTRRSSSPTRSWTSTATRRTSSRRRTSSSSGATTCTASSSQATCRRS